MANEIGNGKQRPWDGQYQGQSEAANGWLDLPASGPKVRLTEEFIQMFMEAFMAGVGDVLAGNNRCRLSVSGRVAATP